MRVMRRQVKGLAFCIAAFAASVAAQTNTFPASGNVGIGTTSPGAKLVVIGNAYIGENTNGTAVIDAYDGDAYFGDNSATNGIAVTASGWVGIGTTGPTAQLAIAGGALGTSVGNTSDLLSLQNSNGNANYLNIFQLRSNAGIPSGSTNNWTSATTRIQSVTDVSSQGYIDFNPPGGTWGLAFGSGGSEFMRMLNGNIGIGTTSPGAKLEVDGSVKLTSGSGASITFQDGTVQSTAYTGVTCGGDYAESVDVSGSRTNYVPGDVLVIDPNAPGKFLKSAEAYSTSVTGIYSTKPGTVGRRQTTAKSPDEVPMAMMGIVPTKVSAENGVIRPGDLLVTASKLGYAMKGTDRGKMLGAVIGKALGNLDSGTGVIEVVVTLQ
jgi:hypothetical protein